MGDRSENAEYIYGKKQLRQIDKKVRFLTKRLDSLEVINRLPNDQTKIYFGAWVTIESASTKKRHTYRIVGSDETELNSRYISVEAPLARALIGKRCRDTVSIIKPEEILPNVERTITNEGQELRHQIIYIDYAGEHKEC